MKRRGTSRKQPILDALMIWTAVEWYRRQQNGGSRRRSVREATAWLARHLVEDVEPHPGQRPEETLRALYKTALRERRKLKPVLLALLDDEVEWLCSQEPAIAKFDARLRCISQAAVFRPPRKTRKKASA
jgi:hypothetical protein